MRLLTATLVILLVFAPLVPSTLADGGDYGSESGHQAQDGCRISTADPTNPRINGDCIIWGSGTGILNEASSRETGVAADVTVVTPATFECTALCDQMIELELTVRADADAASTSAADGPQAPLGAYVTANLDAPQGGLEGGTDDGGIFASTVLTPFDHA